MRNNHPFQFKCVCPRLSPSRRSQQTGSRFQRIRGHWNKRIFSEKRLSRVVRCPVTLSKSGKNPLRTSIPANLVTWLHKHTLSKTSPQFLKQKKKHLSRRLWSTKGRPETETARKVETVISLQYNFLRYKTMWEFWLPNSNMFHIRYKNQILAQFYTTCFIGSINCTGNHSAWSPFLF